LAIAIVAYVAGLLAIWQLATAGNILPTNTTQYYEDFNSYDARHHKLKFANKIEWNEPQGMTLNLKITENVDKRDQNAIENDSPRVELVKYADRQINKETKSETQKASSNLELRPKKSPVNMRLAEIRNNTEEVPRIVHIIHDEVPRPVHVTHDEDPRTVHVIHDEVSPTSHIIYDEVLRKIHITNDEVPRNIQITHDEVSPTTHIIYDEVPRKIHIRNDEVPRNIQITHDEVPMHVHITHEEVPRTVHITHNVVPRTVHITWFYPPDTAFRFHHAICLLSIQRYFRPTKIFFWHSSLPSGRWWSFTRQSIAHLLLVPYSPPTNVYNRSVLVPEHQSDVARLELVELYGGLYVDLDVILVRPLDPLLR